MENNKRCAIFSPSSFSWTKINGRRNFSRVSEHSRFNYRIFAIFRVFVWASVWLCPCFFRSSLAEQDYTAILDGIIADTGQILGELGNIDGRLEREIAPDIEENRQYLYYIKGNTEFLKNGFGYFGGSAGVFRDDVNTIILRLSNINDNITVLQDGITELELVNQKLSSILDYLEGSGSGGGSSSLPTDIATETTLSAFSNNFQSYYDFIKDGFIYGNGGTGNYGDFNLRQMLWFINYGSPFGINNNYTYKIFRGMNKGDNSPFPDSSHKFPKVEGLQQVVSGVFNTPFERLGYILNDQARYSMENDILLAKKQAWNDWQAHTNSLSRLDMIVSSLNSTPDVYVNDTNDIGTISDDKLNITFDKSTGDSPDSIELQPSFTNDVAELSGPAHSITNKVAKLITYSKLSNRYKTPNVDNTNYRDYGVIQDIPDYNLQYGTRPQMRFSFTATARNLFRGFLSRERMATLRDIFFKLWAFLAIYCNFLIFKIFGKMGGNE